MHDACCTVNAGGLWLGMAPSANEARMCAGGHWSKLTWEFDGRNHNWSGNMMSQKYTLVAIQHVPDAARNEPVNIGVAVADSLSQSTIVMYASGADLDRLGWGRFDGLDMFHSYERETKVGDDAGAYLRRIGETGISCVRFTPPRAAPGDDPKQSLGEMYKRLAAPAPNQAGAAP